MKTVAPRNIYFDAHCHLFNIGDVSLSSIVKRYSKAIRPEDLKTFGELIHFLKKKRILHLLSVLESEIPDIINSVYAELTAHPFTRKKVKVLFPLIMDFEGDNSFEKLMTQADALRKGIDDFYRNTRAKDLFIFPFLGIDVRHFTDKHALEKTLKDSFGKIIRPAKGKTGLENGDYIGIKLYPPLGFDANPSTTKDRELIEELFSFCSEHRIPVTCHCSKLGINAAADFIAKTDPENWLPLVKAYPNLIINFAHCGGKITRGILPSWSRTILEMARDNENIYTDISFIADGKRDMKRLSAIIAADGKGAFSLRDKVLFGTDFSIVLLKTENLSGYLDRALESLEDRLTDFSSRNVLRFLGDGIVSRLPFKVEG